MVTLSSKKEKYICYRCKVKVDHCISDAILILVGSVDQALVYLVLRIIWQIQLLIRKIKLFKAINGPFVSTLKTQLNKMSMQDKSQYFS